MTNENLKSDDTQYSFFDIFKERLFSPLWGTFIISWSLWNWEFWYITFFVDSDKLEATKLIYVLEQAFTWKDCLLYQTFLTWGGNETFLNYAYGFWNLLVLPGLSTLLFLTLFATLSRFVFDLDYGHKIERRKIKDWRDGGYERDKAKILLNTEEFLVEKEKEEIKKYKETEKKIKAKEKLEDSQEQKWDKEYLKFKKAKGYDTFDGIGKSIYEYQGEIKADYMGANGYRHEIPSTILAVSDAYGLIIFNDSRTAISLTEKGKYFMKKYLEEPKK